MIRIVRNLRCDESAASMLEFALVIPALMAMLFGIAELGILFLAQAGLKNAVAEGARYATISPRPTQTQIETKIASKRFGLIAGAITGPTVSLNTTASPAYVDITMGYSQTIYFIFGSRTVSLSETRRAYMPPT